MTGSRGTYTLFLVWLIVGAMAGGSGFAIAELEPGDYEFTLSHDGRQRSFQVHVPPAYDGRPVPLVLDFHGYTSSSLHQREQSGFLHKADAENFIVVWPQGWGIIPSWNAGTCCGAALLLDLDDVGLARVIVHAIAGKTAIELQRVFATGHSNGGALAHLLACRAADLFAAVAPVSFPLAVLFDGQCQPERPVPVIHFHGFYDGVVPYWTPSLAAPRSAPESFRDCREINQCTDKPHTSYWKEFSYCKVSQACSEGVAVSLCSIRGVHDLYDNFSDVDIPELAWEFFTLASREEKGGAGAFTKEERKRSEKP